MKFNGEYHSQRNDTLKKLWLIMKISTLFLFIALLPISANTLGQTINFDSEFNGSTFSEFMDFVEQKTDYKFFLSNSEVDINQRVISPIGTRSIQRAVDLVLGNLDLEYKITEDKLILILGGVENQQQNLTITGKVTDSTGEEIPGVSILIQGTSRGTITDVDGNYSISEVKNGDVLVYSFIGMAIQKVTITNQSLINISLVSEVIGLDEVVAVGYGTMKKSDLTGSVTSVKSEELVEFPTNSALEAVQGKAAGVSILNKGGDPGAGPTILIRGATSINAKSSPLIVVDGFPGTQMPAPEDIESLEILKDASSTAIYGSQGANGVVMITTKKGVKGKLNIEFSGSHSVDVVSTPVEVLNAKQFGEYMNEAHGDNKYDVANLGEGTNWFDLISQNGSKDNYSISLSGGSDKLNFYVSGKYFGHEGIIKNSSYKKYSTRVRLDAEVSEKLKISTSMQMERGIRENQLPGQSIVTALKFNPTQGIYKEDGFTYTTQSVGDAIVNPYATIMELKSESIADVMSFNTSLEYEIITGLKFKSVLGLMAKSQRAGGYTPTVLVSGGPGSAWMNNKYNTKVLTDNYLSYDRRINDVHKVTVMAGTSYQWDKYEYNSTGASNFVTDATRWWNLGSGSVYARPSSEVKEAEMNSFFGRLNYSFDNKYLLTINGRYDGSSKFGDNNKWAFFPSGALAWNVKNESFLQDFDRLDQFKLRATYGVTGNTAISEYGTLAKYGTVFTVVDNEITNAVSPKTLSNPSLSWETTTQTNFGVDLSFWNGKLRVNADYYTMTTEDLLYSAPVVKYSGYNSSTVNFGSTQNKGIEFAVGTDLNFGALKWTIDLNASNNKNEVKSLPGNEVKYSNIPGFLVQNDATQIIQVGSPVGSFYGYIFDGLYQAGDNIIETGKELGDVKYRDLNNDGVINTSDRQIIGNPNPDLAVGLTNRLSYKNFDLSFFLNGVFGNDVYNFTRMTIDGLYGKSNTSTDVLNRWTPTNTNTDIPRAAGTHRIKSSTRWIEDGTYIRLKNLTLGYSLPNRIVSKLGIQSCKLSISGQNLITWTDYKGFDPEVSTSYSNKNIGLDFNSYPNVRSYTFGVKVGF